MWAWIEVILLWRLKGVALNLLRPGENEKSWGYYGGGGVCKLFGEVCIIHMTKIIKNYCIGAARFWQAQAIPPNRLCSYFVWLTDFIYDFCEVQIDLSMHVSGEVPKIPYPDTKVFWKISACGATCFLHICMLWLQIIPVGLIGPRPTGPKSLHQQLLRFWWTHGMNRKCDITTTVQVKICLLV